MRRCRKSAEGEWRAGQVLGGSPERPGGPAPAVSHLGSPAACTIPPTPAQEAKRQTWEELRGDGSRRPL